MITPELLVGLEPRVLSNGVSAGTGDTQTGTAITCLGPGCNYLFMFHIGTITSTGTAVCSVEGSTDGTNYAAMTSDDGVTTPSVSFADTDGSKLGVILVANPNPKIKKIRPKVVRATANVVITAITCVISGNRIQPPAVHSTVLSFVRCYCPGT